MYVAPDTEVKLTVKSITEEAAATPSGTVQTRKYALVEQNVGGTFGMTVTIDDKSRLARLEAPTASLTVVRSDLAGVAVRPHTARNPTDVDVRIPANGFSIAGTLTTPPTPGRLRHPVVVLVAGSGSVDRDETVAGFPILSQLCGSTGPAWNHGASLRQTGRGSNRRPHRNGHAAGLRGRSDRRRPVAVAARRCRCETADGGWPQ
jgi:hypothetical protein